MPNKPIDQKRRQKALRKIAAGLRILDGEQIIPVDYPVTFAHADGTLVEFHRDRDGSYYWNYDGERENASN